MLGERNFSSSSGSVCEQKRVCELEEKQWRTDRDESGSESMTEHVAPAPAVYYATPAPPTEFVNALTCDRVQRTSTISDLFYAQSAVPHHGRSHHWCHR